MSASVYRVTFTIGMNMRVQLDVCGIHSGDAVRAAREALSKYQPGIYRTAQFESSELKEERP